MTSTTHAIPAERAAIGDRRPRRAPLRIRWDFLGVVPFFMFVIGFQVYPALSIITRTFQHNDTGQFTLANLEALNSSIILNTYLSTIQLSLITAVLGTLFGFFIATAITVGGTPKWIRSGVLSFSSIASNFAGLPLVFAFTATLGRRGILTTVLDSFGIALYPEFSLGSFLGLIIVYLYFQIPLMVLIMVPAIEALKREWREACENLGATRWQYWRFVALPILFPSILATLALLFGNAFGTHATAYALVGGGAGQNMVVTLLVDAQFRTDALSNPGLGNAIAFGMIIVMGITIFIYTYFRSRAAQWLPR